MVVNIFKNNKTITINDTLAEGYKKYFKEIDKKRNRKFSIHMQY